MACFVVCGLCGIKNGIGIGCRCWVCEPPEASDPSYPAYREALLEWRKRLWAEAYRKAIMEGSYR